MCASIESESKSGVKMIEEITIQNFRCFEDFHITGLKRINLITGDNNVGKTSLLEALWVHSSPSNPNTLIRANLFRVFTGVHFRKLLYEYFHNYDYTREIRFQSILSNKEKRIHSIKAVKRLSSTRIVPSQPYDSSPDNSIDSIPIEKQPESPDIETVERYDLAINLQIIKNEDKVNYNSKLYLTPNGEVKFTPMEISFPTSIYLFSAYNASLDAIPRLSEIIRAKEKKRIVECLKIIEPRLRDLEIGVMGKTTVVYGDIGLDVLIPLQLQGEGIYKLFGLAVAIKTAKNGSVLIDEFATGFHYSRLPKLWQTLIQLSKDANAQIFVATHSKEVVEAAYEVFKENFPDDLLVINLYRKDDSTRAATYDIESLEGALETGMEVR